MGGVKSVGVFSRVRVCMLVFKNVITYDELYLTGSYCCVFHMNLLESSVIEMSSCVLLRHAMREGTGGNTQRPWLSLAGRSLGSGSNTITHQRTFLLEHCHTVTERSSSCDICQRTNKKFKKTRAELQPLTVEPVAFQTIDRN